MSSAPGQVHEPSSDALLKGRSPMAHLLHALNQPLTGLQCSLELVLVGSRTVEQYVHALRDGLKLTERMRALVDAIRELSDAEQEEREASETLALEIILHDTVEELRPVADERDIQIQLEGSAALPVRATRRRLDAIVFRLLDSAISLAAGGGTLSVKMEAEGSTACIRTRWSHARNAPEHSPFSRPELGLLIAQASCRRLGAEWTSLRVDAIETVVIRLPLARVGNELPSESRPTS